MSRNVVIVLISLALLAGVYAGVYRMLTADAADAMATELPELEWLRREYSVSDEQFAEIRARHEKHDIVCRQLCLDFVNAQKRLDRAIAVSPEMGPEVETALADWGARREACRAAAIRHMYDISAVMNPEQAARYRERIYRELIVPGRMPHVDDDGEFHEELIEHAAPAEAPRSADD